MVKMPADDSILIGIWLHFYRIVNYQYGIFGINRMNALFDQMP